MRTPADYLDEFESALRSEDWRRARFLAEHCGEHFNTSLKARMISAVSFAKKNGIDHAGVRQDLWVLREAIDRPATSSE